MLRRHAYVGPERIRAAARTQPRGTLIDSPDALRAFLKGNPVTRAGLGAPHGWTTSSPQWNFASA